MHTLSTRHAAAYGCKSGKSARTPPTSRRSGSNSRDLAGIDEVRTNSTTGSIILLHSLENNTELLKRLPQLALFEITDCQQHDASAFTPLRSGLTGIEQLLRNGTAGSVDLKTVAFIGVMGLTLHQIMRGQVLGPALPMLWNAFSLINRMNSEPPDSPSNDAGT